MFNIITLEVMETFTSIKKLPFRKMTLILHYRKGDKISVSHIDEYYQELINEGKMKETYNMYENLQENLCALNN